MESLIITVTSSDEDTDTASEHRRLTANLTQIKTLVTRPKRNRQHYFSLLKIRKFSRGFYFRETSHIQNFVKIKSPRNHSVVY